AEAQAPARGAEMTKSLLSLKLFAAIAALIGLVAPAGTLIVALDERATLAFRQVGLPRDIGRGSYSCFIRLNPAPAQGVRRRVLSITGGVKITIEPGAGVRVLDLGSGFEATAMTTLQPGAWSLIAISREGSDGRLDIWAATDGASLNHGFFQPPYFPPG